MAVNGWIIERTVDLAHPPKTLRNEQPYEIAYTGDMANPVWRVHVLQDGQPVALGGSVKAYIRRIDGAEVISNGTISRNTVTVKLGGSNFGQPGYTWGILRYTDSTTNATVTLDALTMMVQTDPEGTSVLDPDDMLPTLQELLAELDDMRDATAAAEAAVSFIAVEYSSSGTYAVDDYAIHSGHLYRCTTPITTPETWDSNHWVQVVFGDEVRDVKSALDESIADERFARQVVEVKFSGNIVSPNLLTSGYYNLSDGRIMPSSAWQRDPNYYPISDDQTQYIASFRPFIIFYDRNFNYLSGEQTTSANVPNSIPEGAKYLRYSLSLSPEQLAVAVICFGNVLNSSHRYTQPGLFITNDNLVTDSTLSNHNEPADAYSVGVRVGDASANKMHMKVSGNMANANELFSGYFDISTGEISQAAGWRHDRVYYPIDGETQYIASFSVRVCFYDKNYNFISGEQLSGGAAHNIPSSAKYLRWSSALTDEQIVVAKFNLGSVLGISNDYRYKLLDVDVSDAYNNIDKILGMTIKGNIFNIDEMIDGFYSLSNGSLGSASGWKSTPYYYPLDGQNIICNFRPFIIYYDKDYAFISGVQPDANVVITPPSGAKYIRYSGTPNQTGEPARIITLGDAIIPKMEVTCRGLTEYDSSIVVDPNGGGDYTSLSDALFNNNNDVVVRAGTYDIVAEFKALFGNDVFDHISDSFINIGMFRYGIYVTERKVVFEPGAIVTCDLTNVLNVDSSHRFSPFNLGTNAVIEGLICHATGCWYLIHDDYGDKPSYKNEIKNCVLTMDNAVNANVIGGGARRYSISIVDNCYMDNGQQANTETLRYHNYNDANAQPTVIVKNCRANGKIRARYYGAQLTPKMTFIANNNSTGGGVEKIAESSSFSNDNVNLYAWANIVETIT